MPRGKTPEAPLPASSASNGSVTSIESRELPYFYSNFSNADEVADFLLHKSKSKAGYFLVRPSFRNKTLLTVSVVVADKTVRHTNIIVEGAGAAKKYFLVKEKKFDYVDELIRYYKEHDVKNLQKVTHVRFLHPLVRPNFRDDRSTSSGGSYNSIPHSQGSAGSFHAHAPGSPVDRPPLPARPSHLQRLGSQESFGSQISVFTQNSINGSSQVLNQVNEASGGTLPRGASNNSIPHVDWHLGPSGDSFPCLPSPTLPSPTEKNVNRPPVPIPEIPKAEGNLYYSTPRNVDESIKEELKKVIRESERCDCGIPRDLADLPLGWTVHRSKDAATYGRIFYQNEAGVTSWKLPEEVMRKMTPTHKTNIQKVKLMKIDDDYLENNIHPEFVPRTRNPSIGSGSSEGKRFSNTQF